MSAKPIPPNKSLTGAIVKRAAPAMDTESDDEGKIVARVSQIDVVDHDGDVMRPGSIPDGAPVIISDYGHNSMFGAVPVGEGKLFIVGNDVILRGQYFLDISPRAREAFKIIKRIGPKQQWSWSFLILEKRDADDEWTRKGARRLILRTDPIEASAVARGAGRSTATISAKRYERLTAEQQAEVRRIAEDFQRNQARWRRMGWLK